MKKDKRRISGENLRRRIESIEGRIGQKKLAEDLGVAPRSVRRYKKGTRRPKKKTEKEINLKFFRTFRVGPPAKPHPGIKPSRIFRIGLRKSKRDIDSIINKALKDIFKG